MNNNFTKEYMSLKCRFVRIMPVFLFFIMMPVLMITHSVVLAGVFLIAAMVAWQLKSKFAFICPGCGVKVKRTFYKDMVLDNFVEKDGTCWNCHAVLDDKKWYRRHGRDGVVGQKDNVQQQEPGYISSKLTLLAMALFIILMPVILYNVIPKDHFLFQHYYYVVLMIVVFSSLIFLPMYIYEKQKEEKREAQHLLDALPKWLVLLFLIVPVMLVVAYLFLFIL